MSGTRSTQQNFLPALPNPDVPGVSRPAASPVDVFVRPFNVPSENGLTELARSLGSLAPTLSAAAAEARGMSDDREIRQARMDAEAAGIIEEAEAVRQGRIQPGASRVYMRAWREAQARAMGVREAEQALREWFSADNAERNSDDPQALDRFLTQRRQRLMEQFSDANQQASFMAAYGSGETRLRQAGAQEAIRREEQRAEESLGALMLEAMRDARRRGLSHEQAIAAAQASSAGMRFAGLRGDRANRILANSLIALAEESMDSRWLVAAQAPRPDVTRPGQTVPGLATIPEYATLFTRSRRSIEAAAYTADSRAEASRARREREAVQRTNETFTLRLEEWRRGGAQGAPPDLTEDEVRVIARAGGAQAVAQVRNVARAFGTTPEIPMTPEQQRDALAEAQRRIYATGQSAAEVANALFIEGRITDMRTLENVRQATQSIPQAAALVNGDPEVRLALREFTSRQLEVGAVDLERPLAQSLRQHVADYFQTTMLAFVEQRRAETGQSPTRQEISQEAARVRALAEDYLSGWGASAALATQALGQRLMPGQDLPAAPPPVRRGAPAAQQRPRQATEAAPAPPQTPMERLEPSGQITPPPAPPSAEAPRNRPVGSALPELWSSIANALSSPAAEIPVPEGLPLTPLAFPERGIVRLGWSGAGAPVQWRPSYLFGEGTVGQGAPVPPAHVAALLRALSENPDDLASVRAFDRLHGRNAAYFYVREFNRRLEARQGR